MTWRDTVKRLFVSKIMSIVQSKESNEVSKAKVDVGASLNEDPITAMINQYKAAEKNWLTSSMNREQEISCRLSFIRTHQKELQLINKALLASNTPEFRKGAVEKLEDLGIAELVKDFNAVYNSNGRQPGYIYTDQNSYAQQFRADLAVAAQKKGITDEPMPSGLADFQKYLYTKSNRGLDGSTRPFIDNFMALPERVKLKVMYSLVHDMKDQPVTDEMIEGYNPDAKEVISSLRKPKWRIMKKIGPKEFDFHKLKQYMDKEVDAEAARSKQAQELVNAQPDADVPETDKPQLKITKQEINDTAVDAFNLVGVIGAVGVPILTHASGAAAKIVLTGNMIKQANVANVFTAINGTVDTVAGGIGAAMSAVSLGKNCVDFVINTKKEKAIINAKKQLSELKKSKNYFSLKPDQKDALNKLETSIKVSHSLNVAKSKTIAVDGIVNAANIASSFANPTVALVVGLGSMYIGSKVKKSIEKNTTRQIVDINVCKSKDDFNKKKANAVFHATERYMRMPKKLQKKYDKDFKKFNSDDDVLKASLREQAVRENGTVDLDGLKNQIIYDVGDSTYLLLRNQQYKKLQNSQDEVDKIIENISNTVVEAAGGRTIDFSGMNSLDKEANPQEREMVANNITERAVNLTRA